jgi:acyl-CoA reductase-like NAD-dependent aldehyde dehydrogenase
VSPIHETTIDGRLIIDGRRLDGDGILISKSPATLEPVGEVHLAPSARCLEAIAAAERAFPIWRETSTPQRQRIFRSARQILLRRADEASSLLSREKGSPLMESMAVEVQGSWIITAGTNPRPFGGGASRLTVLCWPPRGTRSIFRRSARRW